MLISFGCFVENEKRCTVYILDCIASEQIKIEKLWYPSLRIAYSYLYTKFWAKCSFEATMFRWNSTWKKEPQNFSCLCADLWEILEEFVSRSDGLGIHCWFDHEDKGISGKYINNLNWPYVHKLNLYAILIQFSEIQVKKDPAPGIK